MKLPSTNREPRPGVSSQFHCVWMAAGVLSYQLCDREFDCENCQLDAAMRRLYSRQQDHFPITLVPSAAQPTGELSEEYLYSVDHCWVQLLSTDIVRVGLAPIYTRVLFAPKAIVLPPVGQELKPGNPCLWIVVESRTIPMNAPVRGKVSATNGKLSEHPYELLSQPFTSWLCEIQTTPGSLKAARLLSRDHAERLYDTETKRFHSMIADALRDNTGLGRTLHDGGTSLADARSMLGAQRYFELVCGAFQHRLNTRRTTDPGELSQK